MPAQVPVDRPGERYPDDEHPVAHRAVQEPVERDRRTADQSGREEPEGRAGRAASRHLVCPGVGAHLRGLDPEGGAAPPAGCECVGLQVRDVAVLHGLGAL